jgi:hypothetical protein
MSDLVVGGGALAHVMYPQHESEAKGPRDVYRSGAIELRGPLARARLSSLGDGECILHSTLNGQREHSPNQGWTRIK